jgi:hypothetical protein
MYWVQRSALRLAQRWTKRWVQRSEKRLVESWERHWGDCLAKYWDPD